MASLSPWNVEFYQDAQGHRPVEDWLRMLNDGEQARIRWLLALLEVHGTQLGMPYSRHVRGQIWELRITSGRRSYRILHSPVAGHTFALLHAFSKKTEKTPARDLALAEQRFADYRASIEKGN